MRTILTLLLATAISVAQQRNSLHDSLVVVTKNPSKGFYNDYLLFLPKGTPLDEKTFLLVEPNNTGRTSDSIAIHRAAAIELASIRSLGNNVSTELRIPLLVPVFPRPAAKELVYTHALDRDVMLEHSPELRRLDLQLLAMIEDARQRLAGMHILIDEKILMNGFSASATFTNRFSLLHPEKILALAIGGFNGELILPQAKIDGARLDYPLGTADMKGLLGKKPDVERFRTIPQYIYMGKLDENDAVQYDDAYDEKERSIINTHLGADVQRRFARCQQIYRQAEINVQFAAFDEVGHWTTPQMNLEVIRFFARQMAQNRS